MKQLSQLIALSIFGVSAIEIIFAIGAAIILVHILISRFSGLQARCDTRKRNQEIENNMWSIE